MYFKVLGSYDSILQWRPTRLTDLLKSIIFPIMILQPFNKNDFKNYANKLKYELDILQNITMPSLKTWEIDWNACLKIYNTPCKLKA